MEITISQSYSAWISRGTAVVVNLSFKFASMWVCLMWCNKDCRLLLERGSYFVKSKHINWKSIIWMGNKKFSIIFIQYIILRNITIAAIRHYFPVVTVWSWKIIKTIICPALEPTSAVPVIVTVSFPYSTKPSSSTTIHICKWMSFASASNTGLG